MLCDRLWPRCVAVELRDLLSQRRCAPRPAEVSHLCLMDAREAKDYNARHIITAKNAKMDSDGTFPLPVAVEVDSMQHVVVYDSSASCLQERGSAVECARVLAQASLGPVLVRGGFQRFSALYPFLRTEKMMSTIMDELYMDPVNKPKETKKKKHK